MGDCDIVRHDGLTVTSQVARWSVYAVSQKNCAKLFLSEVRQISTNFDNFWHTDSAKDRFMWGALIFHLT